LDLPTIYDFCLKSTYGSTEVQSWDWSFTADKKVAKLEADLHVKTDTTRMQVYFDLELLSSTGTFLTRVWQGQAQVTPVVRNATANTTVYRLVFQPGSAGWTVANGQKLRVKIASKYAQAHAEEPLPAIYTLYHNAPRPSKVTLTYVP
ncbi:MAG TPA: hypothetical protein VHF47_01685, partial [Acidimicrobiales bacterium]|nr:hypothetical protein [Acidimicrobiales bacterium]